MAVSLDEVLSLVCEFQGESSNFVMSVFLEAFFKGTNVRGNKLWQFVLIDGTF